MEQEKNDRLLDDLMEAKGSFDNLIREMMDSGMEYPYEKVIKMEEASYTKCYNAVTRMNKDIEEYNHLYDENSEYLDGERKIILEYIILYIMSIFVIKILSKTLSHEKLNEIWYMLIGLFLGTGNMALTNSHLNEYRYGDESSRKLRNDLMTLKEDYKENYDIAYKEIELLFSLNRNLWQELDQHIKTK